MDARRPAVADLYRKRPVTVEVMGPLTVESAADIAAWCGGQVNLSAGVPVMVLVPTLEGVMRADMDDFVIRGVRGEFYPVRADIFAETYESAEPVFVMHGPMWQFECETCRFMGDCWDTESEAAGEMERHVCHGGGSW